MKKFIILFFSFIIFLQIFSFKDSILKKKILHESKKLKTPSGSSLKDHYGTSKYRDIYGQHSPNNLNNLMLKTGDNGYTNIQNPFVDQLNSTCDISQNSYYQICSAMEDCKLCSQSQYCGWCQSSQKCLPGTISSCACSDNCPQTWIFENKRCEGSEISSGNLSNISPEATKLIPPSEATPKISITTTTNEFSNEQKPVIVGSQLKRQEVLALDKEGNRIVSGEALIQQPITENVRMPVMKEEKIHRVIDPITGQTKYERIISGNKDQIYNLESPVYHGK